MSEEIGALENTAVHRTHVDGVAGRIARVHHDVVNKRASKLRIAVDQPVVGARPRHAAVDRAKDRPAARRGGEWELRRGGCAGDRYIAEWVEGYAKTGIVSVTTEVTCITEGSIANFGRIKKSDKAIAEIRSAGVSCIGALLCVTKRQRGREGRACYRGPSVRIDADGKGAIVIERSCAAEVSRVGEAGAVCLDLGQESMTRAEASATRHGRLERARGRSREIDRKCKTGEIGISLRIHRDATGRPGRRRKARSFIFRATEVARELHAGKAGT